CAHRSPANATAPSSGGVTVVDLTPRFLAFYDSATAQHAEADQRWALWKRLYGVAAVLPTPFGQELARRLLDSAWARYPAALPTIRRGVAVLGVSPDSVLRSVVALFTCGENVRMRLTVLVG